MSLNFEKEEVLFMCVYFLNEIIFKKKFIPYDFERSIRRDWLSFSKQLREQLVKYFFH